MGKSKTKEKESAESHLHYRALWTVECSKHRLLETNTHIVNKYTHSEQIHTQWPNTHRVNNSLSLPFLKGLKFSFANLAYLVFETRSVWNHRFTVKIFWLHNTFRLKAEGSGWTFELTDLTWKELVVPLWSMSWQRQDTNNASNSISLWSTKHTQKSIKMWLITPHQNKQQNWNVRRG